MKIIIRTILYALLTLVLYLGLIFGLFFKGMNWDFYFESTEEMVDEIGEIPSNTSFALKEVSSLKLWIMKSSSVFFKKFQKLNDANIYNMMYQSDGNLVSGILMTPKTPGPHPCVIYNRGGNRDFGRIGFKQISNVLDDLVSNGYVVIASNYRGNNGGQGADEFGGADVADVTHLISILEELEIADASKVGMYGVSRGGMMTYEVLKNQGKIQVAVVKSGSTDLFKDLTHPDTSDFEKYIYGQMIPDYYTNIEASLSARSAVKWPDQMKRVPLLMLHGSGDKRVVYEEAFDLANLLDEIQYPYQLVTYTDDDHLLSKHKRESKARTLEWFDRYLKEGKEFEVEDSRVTVD